MPYVLSFEAPSNAGRLTRGVNQPVFVQNESLFTGSDSPACERTTRPWGVRNSPSIGAWLESGVLGEIVRAVLARTSFALSCQDAPLEAGGWGATIVILR